MSTTLSKASTIYLQDIRIKLTKQRFDEVMRTLYRLKESMGDLVIDELNTDLVQTALLSIKEKYNMQSSTLYYSVLQIKKFFKFCVSEGMMTKNTDVNKLINYKKFADSYYAHFKLSIPESVYPSDEYEMRLFWLKKTTSLISLRNAIIINILFDTGVSVNELETARIVNISLDDRILSLRGKNKRDCSISYTTALLIGKYILLRRDKYENLLLHHRTYVNSNITRRTIERVVIITSRGIKSMTRVTPNIIRQSYMAKMFAEGKIRTEVSKIMGYKNYHVPQLNKYSIADNAIFNRPDKNVSRYLADFKKERELKNELEIDSVKMSSAVDSVDVEKKKVSRTLLLSEADVLEFLSEIQKVYEGYIAVAVRQKEWELSKDLFTKYEKLNNKKFKKVDKLLYIDELVTKREFLFALKN